MTDSTVDGQENNEAPDLESQIPDLANMLKDFENAPSETQIEKWKQQYGEVFVSGFSETELFVWHPLSRPKYVELQKQMRAQATSEMALTELDFEQAVVDSCLLWASNSNSLSSKGGSVSTLSEQIMINSNFMAPAMASVLLTKL